MIKDSPFLLFSDRSGKVFSHPKLRMVAQSGGSLVLPDRDEFLPLPKDSIIFSMPGHTLYGYEKENGEIKELHSLGGKQVFPVSAFLIPGYTRLLLPAARKIDNSILPLWPYCAVGWHGGRFWVTAIRIDNLSRQRPHYYSDRALLQKKIKQRLKDFPGNRLFKHLSKCAWEYNCRAGWNLFLKRWEAPLPTSRNCNSRCVGCLSRQDSDCAVASHQRINFSPTPREIAEVALSHIHNARDAVVSFGQGCEGEPLMQFKAIREAISIIRKTTKRGTINLNTNASVPHYIEKLANVGLDSIRVSLNSTDKKIYDAYYRPRGYKFSDVIRSIKIGKRSGLFVSLNLLVFPGVIDTPKELEGLSKIILKLKVDAIQMRNLSIDPQFYLASIPKIKEEPMGIRNLINKLKQKFPSLKLGYFNRPKD